MDMRMLKKYIGIGVSLSTIFGSLTTSVGLIYTFNQFLAQQKTWREEKTLELYKAQLADPLLKNRMQLDVFYDSKWRKQYLEAIKDKNMGKSEQYKKLEEFTKEFSKGKSKEILTLTNFYEGLVNCVETKICDEETTRSLFEKDIQEFVVLFGPFFCNLRQELNDDKIALKLLRFYSKKEQGQNSQLCPKNNSTIVAKSGNVFQK